MRILYIANDLAYFRAHRENIALAMAAKGHNVFVASGDWQHTSVSDWPSNMSLIPLDLNKHALDIKSDFRLVRKLRTLISSEQPDIVHAITIKPILISALASQFSVQKFKLIWTFPGLGKVFEPSKGVMESTRRKIVSGVLKLCVKNLDVYATFENPGDRELMVSQLDLPWESSSVLWGAGISFNQFEPDSAPTRFPDTAPVVLMASRLVNEKGVDTFLQAAALLKSHPSRPVFKLAGTSDPTNPDCIDQEVIGKAVLSGDVEFLGPVSQERMPALYNRTDVFCLPTRLREGFPKSLMEAAACGCALIATDQKAINRLVIPSCTGWLLSKPDGQNLRQAVEAALSNLQETKEMGQRAYHLSRTLDAANGDIVRQFENIYFYDNKHGITVNTQMKI